MVHAPQRDITAHLASRQNLQSGFEAFRAGCYMHDAAQTRNITKTCWMDGVCLQERLELQRQAEAEFAAERALVDEVVARIQQEDRMELAARRSKQADTKVWCGMDE
jgi:hypothetical protein